MHWNYFGPLVCVISLLSSPLVAQSGFRFFPGGDLPRVLVSPRIPHMGIRLIGVGKGASDFRDGVEWEANFGHGIPFLQFGGSTPDHSIVLGVAAGVFGRFAFETKKRDLISSDWVFTAPLFWRNGMNWVRFNYRHISSHLGDDYILRFGQNSEGYLRDDVGVTVYRQVTRSVGLYSGGNYAFNVDPNDNKRGAFNFGFQVNDLTVSTPWYGGVDVYVDEDSDWNPRLNLHLGRRTLTDGQRGLRFTFEMLIGPSPQGEFRRGNVFLLATGLVVEL